MSIECIQINNAASEDDLMDFAKLHTSCTAERAGRYVFFNKEDIEKIALETIDNREKEIFLLFKKDTQPIATLAAEIKDNGNLRLRSLFVDKKDRNKGVWSEALSKAKELVQTLWYKRIYAHILKENEKVQKLAQKNGYTKANWENGSLEEREYIMK